MYYWLIERWYDSKLHYWTGRGTNHERRESQAWLDKVAWSQDVNDACRFWDDISVRTVLENLLGSMGRAAKYVNDKEQT